MTRTGPAAPKKAPGQQATVNVKAWFVSICYHIRFTKFSYYSWLITEAIKTLNVWLLHQLKHSEVITCYYVIMFTYQFLCTSMQPIHL